MKWACGVLTVVQRREELLPQTLQQLKKAGFENPHLFVDCNNIDDVEWYGKFGLECDFSFPPLGPFGNWVTALWSLYVRNSNADRFILFEDDILTYHNLREYLESTKYPKNGYCNLYTFPVVQQWAKSRDHVGWFPTKSRGLGALGLMFDLPSVQSLLSSTLMANHPPIPKFGWKRHDGKISAHFKSLGKVEYCHNPSLVQHAGQHSSTIGVATHPLANSFRGEEFDASSLIKGS